MPFHHIRSRATPSRVVLARYMQILLDNLASMFSNRAINSHDGFLPTFKGALPYQQAYAQGVKTVGATAH